MTGFQTAGEWLDFAGSVGLEIRSPLFDHQSIPGVLSYPVSFQDTPRNRRLLGFPALRARRVGPVAAAEADLYVGGSLWRRGLLQYQGYDAEKGEYTYQFQADADALGAQLQDALLSGLDLGTVPVQLDAETADYVLLPVRNAAFYDKEKNPAWGTIANYYTLGGRLPANTDPGAQHVTTTVPMLKLGPLLTRVLALYGWEIGGPWLDDPEIQQLVVYSIHSLDLPTGASPATSFRLADALPDVRVADLLLTLQQLFALGFVFNAGRRQIQVVPLRAVVAGTGYQTRAGAGPLYRDVANALNGFRLAFTADSDDELLKSAPWPELTLGGGAELIQPAADTLRMVREADPQQPGREWLVPAAEQPGYSARTDFDQASTRSSQLRLLFYRGLQPDSQGHRYPLGTAGAVDYHGATVGQYALAWDGPQGLYQQWHKPWLDFRANARQEERDVQLTLGEFLALDPTRADRVQGLHFLWEAVSLTVGGEQTLAPASFTYHQL